MKLSLLEFKGHFEEESREMAERLQLVTPEDDLEQDLLSWAILAHDETVSDDPVRRNYVFHYELGSYLERGLYRLKLSGRDASGVNWKAEIAAAVVSTGAAMSPARGHGFIPFWFISKHLHFRASDMSVDDRYGGHAYGHLIFGGSANLPHRRLFRAVV